MRTLGFFTVVALAILSFASSSHAQAPVTAPSYLFITGSGEITPYQDGDMLNVGQDYEMTALRDPGFAFASWELVNVFTFYQVTVAPDGSLNPPTVSDVLSPVPDYTYQPVLDFTMQPSTVILDIPGVEMITANSGWQANFTPTPEPSVFALLACGLLAIIFLPRARSKGGWLRWQWAGFGP